jgi:hypothetical protein
MPGSNIETWGGSVMVRAAILKYSVHPIITLHGLITAREYVDRHLMIQMLFPTKI